MDGRKFLKLAILLISLSTTACSTSSEFNSSSAADSKMAVIKGIPGWNPLSVMTVEIYSVDGKSVSLKNNRLKLQPGEHEIKVRCRRESAEAIQKYHKFKLQLKAGYQYKPKLDMTKDCYLEFQESLSLKRFKPLKD